MPVSEIVTILIINEKYVLWQFIQCILIRSKGSDINHVNYKEKTALWITLESNKFDCAKLLLSHDTHINTVE